MFDIDPNQIFIARQEQISLFRHHLQSWKQKMLVVPAQSIETAPSPENKIQGLVVLLYGHSGFGKSILQLHYHKIASEEQYHFKVGRRMNWENIVEEHGVLFNPLPGHDIDTLEYFILLHRQLAMALDKRLHEFKEFTHVTREIAQVRQQADTILRTMQKDDRYAALRWLTGEITIKLIQLISPRTSAMLALNNEQVAEKIKEYAGKGAEIGVKHLQDVYSRLKESLGSKLDDCLEPALRLGLALGHDLHQFARDFPVLVFFDTYEKVNMADRLLRIVMGAAGVRVGWIIASRDNLLEMRQENAGSKYSYREIVHLDTLLPVSFTAGETKDSATTIYAFTSADILEYFDQAHKQIPSLPALRKRDAEQIWRVTQGVPLAVRIAADLYAKKPDLRLISKTQPGIYGIVHQMVQRYLRYAPDSADERFQIYGLALLRRTDDPNATKVALRFSAEQADGYENTLLQLQQRYSFIFTEQGQPTLHPEVRHFLRLWLLEHRQEPDKAAIITRLKAAQQARLETLEQRRAYKNLQQRLEDDEWVGVFQDIIEVQFWDDIVEGVRYSLSFLLATAIYRRDAAYETFTIGEFFKEHMPQPYLNWWRWATQSLQYPTSYGATDMMLKGLEELAELIQQRILVFAPQLEEWRDELEAAVWWRLGEAYQNRENDVAFHWFERALTRLQQPGELSHNAARLCYKIAYHLYEREEYGECISLLHKAVEFKYDYTDAYYLRGNAYFARKMFPKAIVEYLYVLTLDPDYTSAYTNLGNTYFAREEYQQAIDNYTIRIAREDASRAHRKRAEAYSHEYADLFYNRANAHAALKEYSLALNDFEQAIHLRPAFAWAWMNRGNVYAMIQDDQNALADYNQALKLAPRDINVVWTTTWANFDRIPPGMEMAAILENIASLDSRHYVAYVCRGLAKGWRGGNLNETVAEVEQAIVLEAKEWDPYFWKGMACAYLGHDQEASDALQKALTEGLPPLLLKPLYWLEQKRPEFFEQYARPLLDRYHL